MSNPRAALKICLLNALMMASVSVYARQPVTSRVEGPRNETPAELKDIGITEHLGDSVNLDLSFRNEKGEVVPLRTFFQDHRPVVLSLAYYSCPTLCSFHLNGMTEVFKKLSLTMGKDFHYVIVSIDPRENAELAAAKKENYLKAYGRAGADQGWHFLTGEEKHIQELAKTVGFGYRWDEEEQQYAHASAAYVLTPEGKISRYLYGIDFQPQTLRLSLVEAANSQIGTIVDKLTLFCFHYDPKAGKFTPSAMFAMRAGGLGVVAVLAAFLAPFWLRNRRVKAKSSVGFKGEV